MDSENRFDWPYHQHSKQVPGKPGTYLVYSSYGGAYIVERSYQGLDSLSADQRAKKANWRTQVWSLYDITDPTVDVELVMSAINKKDLMDMIYDLEDARRPTIPPATFVKPTLTDLDSLVARDEDRD